MTREVTNFMVEQQSNLYREAEELSSFERIAVQTMAPSK